MTQRAHHIHLKSSGFSLMEMTVVLTVLAVLATSGLSIFKTHDYNMKRENSLAKLDALQEAMYNYRYVHHRLPCPALDTLASTATGFGIEAANPGGCSGGSPAIEAAHIASDVAMGVVPVRALELSDEYMYDGWGRKITYLVDIRATATNSMIDHGIADTSIGNIEVKDGSGNARTESAIYALISHGENGYGAYLEAGATTDNPTGRRLTGSENTEEQDNAALTAGGANDFDNELVAKPETKDSTDPDNTFDDLVVFKERWNLMTASDKLANRTRTGNYGLPDFVFGRSGTTGPYLSFGDMTPTSLTTSSRSFMSTADTPTASIYGVALSQDNQFLAVGYEGAPYLNVYQWYGERYVKLDTSGITLPDGSAYVSWSFDDPNSSKLYLAATSVGGSQIMNLYVIDKSVFPIAINNILNPVGLGLGVIYALEFNPAGKWLVATGNGTELYSYNTTDNSFTEQGVGAWCTIDSPLTTCTATQKATDVASAVVVTHPAWNSTGTKLAIGVVGGEPPSIVYDFDSATPLLSETYRYSAGGAWEIGVGVQFSPDDQFLIEGYSAGYRIYQFDSITDQRYENIAALGGSACSITALYNAAFSKDGKYVALGGTSMSNPTASIINYTSPPTFTCATGAAQEAGKIYYGIEAIH